MAQGRKAGTLRKQFPNLTVQFNLSLGMSLTTTNGQGRATTAVLALNIPAATLLELHAPLIRIHVSVGRDVRERLIDPISRLFPKLRNTNM